MAVSKVVLGDETLVDLTSDTVSEDTLLKGATAHAANGEQITGGVVVTPMYTGTKSAIESAIASGEIPEGAVVNITDDEEASSFQAQINEINSSLNDIAFGKIVATGSSITIFFEKEFSEIPIVIATCVASGADRTVTVSNITKSECTFYAWMNGNAVSGSVINWIAIGK